MTFGLGHSLRSHWQIRKTTKGPYVRIEWRHEHVTKANICMAHEFNSLVLHFRVRFSNLIKTSVVGACQRYSNDMHSRHLTLDAVHNQLSWTRVQMQCGQMSQWCPVSDLLSTSGYIAPTILTNTGNEQLNNRLWFVGPLSILWRFLFYWEGQNGLDIWKG